MLRYWEDRNGRRVRTVKPLVSYGTHPFRTPLSPTGLEPGSNGSHNVVEPLPHDQAGYFDLTTDQASNVRKKMVEALEELQIKCAADVAHVLSGQPPVYPVKVG